MIKSASKCFLKTKRLVAASKSIPTMCRFTQCFEHRFLKNRLTDVINFLTYICISSFPFVVCFWCLCWLSHSGIWIPSTYSLRIFSCNLSSTSMSSSAWTTFLLGSLGPLLSGAGSLISTSILSFLLVVSGGFLTLSFGGSHHLYLAIG